MVLPQIKAKRSVPSVLIDFFIDHQLLVKYRLVKGEKPQKLKIKKRIFSFFSYDCTYWFLGAPGG
jgi:hypothetical protein